MSFCFWILYNLGFLDSGPLKTKLDLKIPEPVYVYFMKK